MSDNYIRFIPTDPNYVGDASALERAREHLLALVPDAAEVTANVTEAVQFVDQGANFERVSCPACHAELKVSWWHEAMDVASETGFVQLSVIVPCCGSMTSLNDLDCYFPAGFARMVLEAMNPNIRDIDPAHAAVLESILGTPIRRVWAHY